MLGLTYPPDQIFSAWDRITNGRPAVRSEALEYLSNVFSRKHRKWLFPLIEADSWSALSLRSREADGVAALEFGQALGQLVRHRDPWLSAVAVTVVGALDQAPAGVELESLRGHESTMVREAVAGVLDRELEEPGPTVERR